MASKAEFRVTLKVQVYGDEFTSPETWAWHELLDCQPEDVAVIRVDAENRAAEELQAATLAEL